MNSPLHPIHETHALIDKLQALEQAMRPAAERRRYDVSLSSRDSFFDQYAKAKADMNAFKKSATGVPADVLGDYAVESEGK